MNPPKSQISEEVREHFRRGVARFQAELLWCGEPESQKNRSMFQALIGRLLGGIFPRLSRQYYLITSMGTKKVSPHGNSGSLAYNTRAVVEDLDNGIGTIVITHTQFNPEQGGWLVDKNYWFEVRDAEQVAGFINYLSMSSKGTTKYPTQL